jgi:signal transduction histidine kinase
VRYPGFSRTIDVGNLEIFADPLLEKVFLNLTENALHHADFATMLTLRYEKTPAGITLILEDNGNGIPDDKKEAIFQRGAGSQNRLGLFMVREILEITGITIHENGLYGKGARFEIVIPRNGYRFPDDNPKQGN